MTLAFYKSGADILNFVIKQENHMTAMSSAGVMYSTLSMKDEGITPIL